MPVGQVARKKHTVYEWCFFQSETRAIQKAVVLKNFDDFQHLKERVAANDHDEDKYRLRIKLPNVSEHPS